MTAPPIILQFNIPITPSTDPRLLDALNELVLSATGHSVFKLIGREPRPSTEPGLDDSSSYFTFRDYRDNFQKLYPDRTHQNIKSLAERSFWGLLTKVKDSRLKIYHLPCRRLRNVCTCEGVRKPNEGRARSPSTYLYGDRYERWAVDTASFLELEEDDFLDIHVRSREHLPAMQEYLRENG